MSVAQISPTNVAASPIDVNPLAQNAGHVAVAKAADKVHRAIDKSQSDTVTISRHAAFRAQQVYRPAAEAQEAGAEPGGKG
jgi:hypothetical protein